MSDLRYLEPAVLDLALARKKMAFVAGPRQVGKTTLAKRILSGTSAGAYYNWDEIELRRQWVKAPQQLVEALLAPGSPSPLLVFDEIHKARGWKSTLKGLYDRYSDSARFIVTGSARLNIYKKGSDSLMGRYLLFRLHPLSQGEVQRSSGEAPPSPDEALRSILGHSRAAGSRVAGSWSDLRRYGGFPEPFFSQSEKIARIWRRNRLEKIVREDLRDLSRLPELSRVEMLAALLPERAAGTLSPQSLREDLEVSHDTVKRWLGYLEELYYFFEVKPYARSIPRSLKKEGKLYLWDWWEVLDEGARFENMVASHLLKACHYWTDTGEGTFELNYVRDKQKREIDFLIVRDRKPWLAVEAKKSDTAWSPHFDAFRKHLGAIPCLQLVDQPCVFRRQADVKDCPGAVISAAEALRWLP